MEFAIQSFVLIQITEFSRCCYDVKFKGWVEATGANCPNKKGSVSPFVYLRSKYLAQLDGGFIPIMRR